MTKRRTTHVRVEKSLLDEMHQLFPNCTYNEAIKNSLNMYKGIQSAGKFIYGRAWKK